MCLRCRHAARTAARERAKRLLLRGTAGAIVIATLIAAGVVAASSLRSRSAAAASRTSSGANVPVAAPTDSATVPIAQMDTATMISAQVPAPAAATPAAATPSAPKPADAAPFASVLPHGESVLSEGVTVVRSDSDVVVAFDSPMMRTRRPDKFEQFVRTTLGTIYGQPASEALAKLPAGAISSQGDLLTELPTRGIRIPANGGWMFRLFPETRAGQDGPLVVRYRVRVAPIGG